jgi:hypothetical protein
MKYSKTEAGQAAFKVRSTLLSARQRSAFILFDGKRTVAQVLEAAAGLGITQADVDHMVAQSFLAAVELPMAAAQPPVSAPEPGEVVSLGERLPQDRYKAAKPIATKLTAGLGAGSCSICPSSRLRVTRICWHSCPKSRLQWAPRPAAIWKPH